MKRMNFFTGLVFLYSLVVCFTCKQLNPTKCGLIETSDIVKKENKNILKKEAINPALTSTKTILTAVISLR